MKKRSNPPEKMTSPDHSTPSPARLIPKPDPDRAIAIEIQPASPRYPLTPSSFSPSSGASSALFAAAHGGAAATAPHRKIGIPVDLSNESAFAVRWAVPLPRRRRHSYPCPPHLRPLWRRLGVHPVTVPSAASTNLTTAATNLTASSAASTKEKTLKSAGESLGLQ